MIKILKDFREKCKIWWEAHERDCFVVFIMILISAIMVGAGRLWFTESYEIQSHKIVIEENAFPTHSKQGLGQARFMASVNGEKYYPVGCKAANRIKEENRIWFSSEKEAREMGYTLSAQC